MLFLLLLLPIIIGLAGFMFGKGKIVWQEFAIQEAVVILIVCVGYFTALIGKTEDVELWNGTIAAKERVKTGCCHSYPCNCRESCSGSGKDQTCMTICDTCYVHASDYRYTAYTSNNEVAYNNGCFAPSSAIPNRWSDIQIGEPTSIEHSYDNYIKANPDTIIKRTGAKEQFAKIIPQYPGVYDYYRAQHFITDIPLPADERKGTEYWLDVINGELGQNKKVNIILILTKVADQKYIEALREAWIGGKKNDIIVVVGAPEFPRISWAGVISWTKSEEVKINIRNELLELNKWDTRDVLLTIKRNVNDRFLHRSWRDFDYLRATITPSNWVLWLLFILGTGISIGLGIYFYKNDVF